MPFPIGMSFSLACHQLFILIYYNNIKMSVRNIEQGIYNLPDTSNTLDTSIAFNKTITANINVLIGTVTLILPPVIGVIVNSGPIALTLPPEYTFPTILIALIEFSCIVRNDDNKVSAFSKGTLNISNGAITIYFNINKRYFQVGSTNEWGLIYPVTISYNLIK